MTDLGRRLGCLSLSGLLSGCFFGSLPAQPNDPAGRETAGRDTAPTIVVVAKPVDSTVSVPVEIARVPPPRDAAVVPGTVGPAVLAPGDAEPKRPDGHVTAPAPVVDANAATVPPRATRGGLNAPTPAASTDVAIAQPIAGEASRNRSEPLAPAAGRLPPPSALPNAIYFDVDAYLPRAEYRELIEQHARQLLADPRRHVLVQAHADTLGPPDYNLALAEKRADTVIRMLTSLGVNRAQLHADAQGDTKATRTAAGVARRSDRRVDLIYQVADSAAEPPRR